MAADLNEGDVSLSIANDAGDITVASTVAANDPLDLANLEEYEDEAALVNELLAGNDLLAGAGDTAGLGLEDDQTRTVSSAALPELDMKLARLLGTLEHACQDTSAQVERAIEEVSRSVPRLTFDLQLMRENVVLLRYTLDSIRKRSSEAISASETLNVMRRLKVLDTIKTRMEASRDVLREAEAWSSLESEVTALVQEQSYVKAAERLAEANKSMIVFQNSPEYEQRRNLMVSLQNGLEAGLSASLVAAITARDMTACRNYHAIFRQIQRETEFRNYYFGSRRQHLVKDWQNAQLSDCTSSNNYASQDSASQSKSFAVYLPTFYSSLQNTINDERTYIPAIFNDPTDTLSAFLQTTLDSLSPSFPQRISDLSNSHGPRLLLELIRIYHATEECAVAVERTFSTLQSSLRPMTASPLPSPSTPGGPLTTSPNGTPAANTHTPAAPPSALTKHRIRRQSKAMSISRRHSRAGTSLYAPSMGGLAQHRGSADSLEDGDSPAHGMSEPILAWETTLFEPFLDWQAEYADLESRLLRSELARVTSGQDAMAYLLGSLSIAQQNGSRSTEDDEYEDDAAAASGINRAKEAARLLLDQTTSVFSLAEEALGRCMAFTHGYGAAGYIEAVDGILKTFFMNERDTLLRAKDSRMRKRRQEMSTASSANGRGAGEVDLHLDYSQEDLSSLQLALRLLDSCKAIVKKVDQLEHRVCSRLVDVAHLVRQARSDPLNQVIPGTTRGSLALLWQSTLNSASLNALLESIERNPLNQNRQVQLFQQARSASSEITRAAQIFLHETILTPLMATLDGYASLSVWTQASESRPESRGAFDLHIPTFSLSPSEIITRIGEGFLNLPAMFEMYAEDEALGYSLDTLPDLDAEMVKSLRRELQSEAGQNGTMPLTSPHGHGMQQGRHGSKMSIVGNEFLPPTAANLDTPSRPARISPTTGTHASSPPTANSQQPWSTETVISAWLSSLTRAILLHLAKVTIPSIRSLSKHGQEQLASDLGYISNVAKALDVEVEQIEKWRVALEAEERQQQSKTAVPGARPEESGAEAEVEAVEVDQEVAEMLKRMRSNMGRPALAR